MIPVHDWQGFAEAVRRKLVMEIAGTPTAPPASFKVIPAQYAPGPDDSYDCMIGEKIWERYRQYWSEP